MIALVDEKSVVPSVDAAAKILSFLSDYEHRNSSLAEIARETGINKSSCLRILRVLNEHRMVAYDEDTKKYSLGIYLVVLGTKAAEFSDRITIARRYLRRLTEEIKLTSVLVQPITETHLTYVAKEDPGSNLDIKINVLLGKAFPMTITSYGKCFLAYMREEEAEQIIRQFGLKRYTPQTITDPEEFKQNLKGVRARGYAVSYEERTPGITAVAAPVFDISRRVIMVIACLGVSAYMNAEKVANCGAIVKKTADEVTAALGGRHPDDA